MATLRLQSISALRTPTTDGGRRRGQERALRAGLCITFVMETARSVELSVVVSRSATWRSFGRSQKPWSRPKPPPGCLEGVVTTRCSPTWVACRRSLLNGRRESYPGPARRKRWQQSTWFLWRRRGRSQGEGHSVEKESGCRWKEGQGGWRQSCRWHYLQEGESNREEEEEPQRGVAHGRWPRQGEKDKAEKRKSQERAGDASRGRSGPGSARDKKKRHRRRSPSDKSAKKEKKKHKARQRERGSSSAEREGLFGDKGSGSFDESDSEVGGRHADRGPFGAAEVERFSGRKEADSSDESDFREAPAQNMATNQLRLTEYSQKHPGRLAERLLLKMHRESSLISVGAKVGKRQTPAAAMHYLQTMMLPSLGAKVNIRTGRELRTLVPWSIWWRSTRPPAPQT